MMCTVYERAPWAGVHSGRSAFLVFLPLRQDKSEVSSTTLTVGVNYCLGERGAPPIQQPTRSVRGDYHCLTPLTGCPFRTSQPILKES